MVTRSFPASRRGWWRIGVVAAVLMLVLGLCVGWTRSSAPAAGARYYVSIGDSYASGYRPTGPGAGGPSRESFVYQVGDKLSDRQSGWQIVNFACTGETAYSMAFDRGCQPGAGAPDGPDYQDVPQLVAAVDFIDKHRDQIGLVTVVTGGNDVLKCLDEPDAVAAQKCAEDQVPNVKLSLDSLLGHVREAVGRGVPIVGVSYINAFGADALSADPAVAQRAQYANIVFENYLNPALAETYTKYGATFVDTTELAGANLPGAVKSWLPDHGTVPASIGRVCALTYYCTDKDPHPNWSGHALIAGEVERLAGV